MFQMGLMGQMGSGSGRIQECFGLMRNVTPHTVKELRDISTHLRLKSWHSFSCNIFFALNCPMLTINKHSRVSILFGIQSQKQAKETYIPEEQIAIPTKKNRKQTGSHFGCQELDITNQL